MDILTFAKKKKEKVTDFFGKRCCVIYYGCVILLKVTFILKRTCIS